MNSVPTADAMREVDMDLIAQRIMKLAELSMLEHIDGLMRSQADSLLALATQDDDEVRQ